jgi:hypothetical protein
MEEGVSVTQKETGMGDAPLATTSESDILTVSEYRRA